MKKQLKRLMATILVGILLLPNLAIPAQASPVHTGGPRNTTWTEISLDETYVVKGLTAQEILGRPSGTLQDFANAMAQRGEAGSDVIIFPVNFHVTGTPEIVGAIFSRNRIVSAGPQPYLNFGVGFTVNNEMSLFDGRLNNGMIYGPRWDSPSKPHIYTAFNIFPHFTQNGARLPIVPMPGLTQNFINQNARRAFMGQRADGSLVIGNIPSATLHQTQEVAEHFGLVNAVNLDGGASAGIWRNGYITRPGRQLPAVMYVTNTRNVAPPVPGSTPFTDVRPSDWFYDAVRYVFEQDIMRGTSATAFSPSGTLTRAMVATTIHRMAGEPHTPFRPLFSDVVSGQWYSASVTWANDTEIVQGVGGGRFAPRNELTREHLAAMMHRFARYMGYDLSVPAHVTAPAGTSAWAMEYVRWATHNNFIPASAPSASASRAETANFIYRFDLRYGR